MKYKDAGNNFRIYPINESCIFKKNNEIFGGLSNMSNKFPLLVNGLKIKSSEALYQVCKFPDNIDLQKRILMQPSPFTVKLITKGKETREDWMHIRINVMRWCLRIKLAQNYHSFGELLKSTNGKNIVENSIRDHFWGAKKINDDEFKGINALGRLLMELREEYLQKSKSEMLIVRKPDIKNLFLLGELIHTIDMNNKYVG